MSYGYPFAYPRKDLPGNWFERYGDKIIQRVAKYMQYDRLDHRQQAVIDEEWPIQELSDALVSKPFNLQTAQQFYNVPAICYRVSTSSRTARLPICSREWLDDAFTAWEYSIDICERNVDCDNKDPFAIIDICQGDWDTFGKWVGLGLGTLLHGGERQTAQGIDLRSLVDYHQRICDMVQDQIQQPLSAEDECLVSQHRSLRFRCIRPVLSPLCRAILMIALETMTEGRNVLLVLTGHNTGLLGPAPTFKNIRGSEILAERADNVVEVELATAIRYLRYLDDEEEKANEYLRSTTQKRIEEEMAILHNEAVEMVQECARDTRGEEVDIDDLSDGLVKETIRYLDTWGQLH